MKEQGFLKNHRKSLKRLFNPYINPFDSIYTPYPGLEKMIDLATSDDSGNREGTSEIDGAISFPGAQESYLSVANHEDFNLGTGDFTIEWWQYQITGQSYPRIFSIGAWNSATIAVSIERDDSNHVFYLWLLGDLFSLGTIRGVLNHWHHFAVTRNSGSIKVFMNGTQLSETIESDADITDNDSDLTIGGEVIWLVSAYCGYITNFKWTKGRAIYTENFTVSRNRLLAEADTKLLLLSVDADHLVTDSSGTSKTVVNNGNCTFVQRTPIDASV